jgi:hypothetical protein
LFVVVGHAVARVCVGLYMGIERLAQYRWRSARLYSTVTDLARLRG